DADADADADADGLAGDGSDARAGRVRLSLECRGDRLLATVRDNGIGLPAGFDIEKTTSLGLSIVRDLVLSQLEGSITMGPAEGGGTEVVIEVPAASLSR
ncbi:MAG: ATP-binding protein, partial [Acidimicrobiales bacterium]